MRRLMTNEIVILSLFSNAIENIVKFSKMFDILENSKTEFLQLFSINNV